MEFQLVQRDKKDLDDEKEIVVDFVVGRGKNQKIKATIQIYPDGRISYEESGSSNEVIIFLYDKSRTDLKISGYFNLEAF